MKTKLALLSLSGMLLVACGSQSTDTNNQDNSEKERIEELEAELDTANGRIEELEEELAAIDSDASEEDGEDSEYIESESYGLNQEAVFLDDSNTELYGLKIISVTNNLSETDDLYTNGKPENTIEVKYEYKNYNFPEPLDVSAQFITAYGKDGAAGETLSMRDGQTEINEGRSAQSTIWIVMPNPISEMQKVEIDYGADFVTGFDSYVTFDIPLNN